MHAHAQYCVSAASCHQPTRTPLACARAGLFLMEGMWTRFFPTTRAVRKAVADGAIGEVISMTASLGFKSEPEFNERLFRPALSVTRIMY